MPKAIVTRESSRELCDAFARLIQKSPGGGKRSVRCDKIIAVTLTVVIRLSTIMPFTSKEHVAIGILYRVQNVRDQCARLTIAIKLKYFFLSEIASYLRETIEWRRILR